MKRIITTITFLLVTAFGLAQNGAKIEFTAKDNTIDIGKVQKSKDSGICSFEFTNTGDQPLIIKDIMCGKDCKVLSKFGDSIMPGKKSKIEIKYSLIPGPIRKTITLETNAKNFEEGRIPLKIKGEIIAD